MIRDLYLQEENPFLVPLQHGRLFWYAIYAAIRILVSGQGIREQRRRKGRFREGEVSEVPAIRARDIGQDIIDGAFSDGLYAPASSELWPRVQLALALDQECADAYFIDGQLQEKAGQYPLALLAYETAMRLAATRFGGEEALIQRFANNRQEDLSRTFGGKSYLRPRSALAALLWKLEEYQLAEANYQALLTLDPDDRQGIGDALLSLLLEAGEHASLGRVLKKIRRRFLKEEGEEGADTTWLYTCACWHYRRWRRAPGRAEGGQANQEATSALQEAFECNHFVPILLLSPAGLPDLEELSVSYKGDATDAARYVHRALKAWRKTPGALEWLEEKALESGLLPNDPGKRERQLSTIRIAVLARLEDDP